MSLRNLSYVCSHLKNCSMARIGLTSVQYTKMHLGIILGLYRHGMLSQVQLGDFKGPYTSDEVLSANDVASRRIWLSLKYHNSEPLIRESRLVSTPKKDLTLKYTELNDLIRGKRVSEIHPIEPGELFFLTTDKGIMESREAVAIGRGGKALCRIK
ncbi:ribosomal protein S8 [Dipodascopsis uninucleata]